MRGVGDQTTTKIFHIGALGFFGKILSNILGKFLHFANFWTIFCQNFCLLKRIVKNFALIFVIFFALCNFLHLFFCFFLRLTIFSTYFFGIFCSKNFCQKFYLIFYTFFLLFLRHANFSTFVFGIFCGASFCDIFKLIFCFFLRQTNFSQWGFGVFCGANFYESHPVHPVLHLWLSVSNCSIPFNNGQTPKLRDSGLPGSLQA